MAPASARRQRAPAPPAPRPVRVSPVPPAPAGAPITRAELRAWASTHLRGLQRAVDEADAAHEPAQAAAARRMLTQAAPVLARLTPDDPDEAGDTVRVSLSELKSEQDRLRNKMRKLVADLIEDSKQKEQRS